MHALWELSTVQPSFSSLSEREKEVHVRQVALGLTEEREQLCEELFTTAELVATVPSTFPIEQS